MELTYAWDTDRWKESAGPDKYRRGLYTFFQRTAPYPQMINFDAPESNVAVSRRSRSNTPLQALNLLNDPVFHEAAEALAARIARDGVVNGFTLTMARPPDARELEILKGLSPLGVARALLNSDEFITRE